MSKVKIIRSDSLECLKKRINNKLMEYSIQAEQYKSEANQLENRNQNPDRMSYLRQQKVEWERQIRGLREALYDIALFESEIEI